MAHAKVIDRKALLEYKSLLTGFRKRRLPAWTEYLKVDARAGVPPNAKTAKVQYRLWSEYEDIPLMIRISSDAEGKFSQETSGPSGVVELLLTDSQSFYVSLSDPGINFEIGVVKYSF